MPRCENEPRKDESASLLARLLVKSPDRDFFCEGEPARRLTVPPKEVVRPAEFEENLEIQRVGLVRHAVIRERVGQVALFVTSPAHLFRVNRRCGGRR